jgi:asparagine synthase (glutamine-hydrolysing)
MPGIAGIISLRPADHCQRLVESMVASMKHERFYTSGMYAAPNIGVFGGWVAHQDSFADGQVFLNEQKDVALIFSGECFYDRQVRSELIQKGHNVEENKAGWLVHLYEEEGDRFFETLNGLFSGLLIDERKGKAFLFNDRYGTERIYWHETEDAFYFASEAKALLRVLPDLREFDSEGVAQFLTFGCTLEGKTLFRGVKSLAGGSIWTFADTDCNKRKYFSTESWESQPVLSPDSFMEEFEHTFKRTLPRYLDGREKLGMALTAGLDSRMIMACLPEDADNIICYTYSGRAGNTLDAKLAARVAKARGLDHEVLRIGEDFFLGFASHADRTVYITDGCLGILGAHEIYMNKQARQLAPVRLTGNYGSEVLRGASTFKPLRLSPALMAPETGQSISGCAQELANGGEHPVRFAAFREIAEKRFGILAAGRSQTIFRTPYLDNEIVALAFQAPPGVLNSSVPAVRVVKDNNSALADIPTDMGLMGSNQPLISYLRQFSSKVTFKLDYFYNDGLPHWLSRFDPLFRHFSSRVGILGPHRFLHYRSWFQRELGAYVSGIMADTRCRRSPFWNSDCLESMVRDHRTGRKNYMGEINAVITLEAVERLLFRELPSQI